MSPPIVCSAPSIPPQKTDFTPATLEASSTYATNNFAGGVKAGEYLAKVLADAGVSVVDASNVAEFK